MAFEKQTISLQTFQRLSFTNFTWFILETLPHFFLVNPHLKICWFAVTQVCFFRVHPAGRKKSFYNLEMEKKALILIYFT